MLKVKKYFSEFVDVYTRDFECDFFMNGFKIALNSQASNY